MFNKEKLIKLYEQSLLTKVARESEVAFNKYKYNKEYFFFFFLFENV